MQESFQSKGVMAFMLVGVKNRAVKGPTLLFNSNCTISITGGDFNPLINDKPIKMYESINVKLGDTLKINNTKNGARCYLAISGGIHVKSIFGSKSFLSSISESYYLRKGDEIKN